jgi:hypothetical protein
MNFNINQSTLENSIIKLSSNFQDDVRLKTTSKKEVVPVVRKTTLLKRVA